MITVLVAASAVLSKIGMLNNGDATVRKDTGALPAQLATKAYKMPGGVATSPACVPSTALSKASAQASVNSAREMASMLDCLIISLVNDVMTSNFFGVKNRAGRHALRAHLDRQPFRRPRAGVAGVDQTTGDADRGEMIDAELEPAADQLGGRRHAGDLHQEIFDRQRGQRIGPPGAGGRRRRGRGAQHEVGDFVAFEDLLGDGLRRAAFGVGAQAAGCGSEEIRARSHTFGAIFGRQCENGLLIDDFGRRCAASSAGRRMSRPGAPGVIERTTGAVRPTSSCTTTRDSDM